MTYLANNLQGVFDFRYGCCQHLQGVDDLRYQVRYQIVFLLVCQRTQHDVDVLKQLVNLRQEYRCPRANIFDDLVPLETREGGGVFRENVAELDELHDR